MPQIRCANDGTERYHTITPPPCLTSLGCLLRDTQAVWPELIKLCYVTPASALAGSTRL